MVRQRVLWRRLLRAVGNQVLSVLRCRTEQGGCWRRSRCGRLALVLPREVFARRTAGDAVKRLAQRAFSFERASEDFDLHSATATLATHSPRLGAEVAA